jgi:hypothetical protein
MKRHSMNMPGTLLSLLAIALVLGVGSATAQDNVFYTGYFSNANASGSPSAHLRLANDGNIDQAVVPVNLCANIYVFDNAEEMQECCSCEITPDGYLDLTVNGNLIGNILDHGIKPTRGIVEVVGAFFPGVCPTLANTAPEPGIKGWLTHVQKGATSGTFSLSETSLTDSVLTDDSYYELITSCSFVQSLGSGTGVCSCADAGD